MQLKYLVTGTGRCGTVYAARLLTSVGIPCGHELIFDFHGLDVAQRRIEGQLPLRLSYCSTNAYKQGIWEPLPPWLHDYTTVVAESSYMAVPFLDSDLLKDCQVIHIVRNPIKVINSFCNHLGYFKEATPSNSYEEFIYKQVPALTMNVSKYDRACLFYIFWIQMIQKVPHHVYRVEDGPEVLLKFLGLDVKDYFREPKVNSLAKTLGAMFHLNSISERWIKEEFISMATKMGYNLESQYLLV